MLFFLTLSEDHNVSFSPFRERDKLDPGVISYLSPPLPLAIIQYVLDSLPQKKPSVFRTRINRPQDSKSQILKLFKANNFNIPNLFWKEVSRDLSLPKSQINRVQVQDIKKEAEKTFNQLVLGRQLSIGDLRGLARELRLREEEIIELANCNVAQGKARWVPSVKKNKLGWQCQRCGEKDVEEWPSFYGVAATCRSCASIGASTSLNVLYRDNRSLLEGPSKVVFRPHWNLTEAQRLASEQVTDFIKGASKQTALLWAACGAGKTEVCFPSAAWALKQGKAVLFAAPRQDVIHDIAPRLQRDFPDYPLQILTGASPVKFQTGGLVLATTHQVLRFWKSFDVIFMDEMDAFPYHGSSSLEWGLNQALRQGGKLLYLTATPSPIALKAVWQGQLLLIRLPARHHRNPLPVPIWTRSGNFLEPNKCFGVLDKQIESLRRQGPVMVFVPKISWLNPWIKCFKLGYSGWHVDGSYSADPGRSAKIKKLERGHYDIFVSTTILERGITLQGVQVVVLGADHPVFDERVLVQMAGRVGRTRESPDGKVIFFAEKMTPAMKKAIHWIKEQNQHALNLGLIERSH